MNASFEVLDSSLSSDLTRLVEDMARVCESHRRHSATPAKNSGECLTEVIAAYTVYRTYVSPGTTPSERDVATVTRAVTLPVSVVQISTANCLTFLRDVLYWKYRASRNRNGVRFQQVTGPVMAKAVEDTFFYRYMPLLALNEVGGDPGAPRHRANEFHSWCAGTHARHPFGLLATSTHDTKRSEDVRARMSVLSEVPKNGRSGRALARARPC